MCCLGEVFLVKNRGLESEHLVPMLRKRGVTEVTLLMTVVSLVDNAGHHNSLPVSETA